MVDLYSDVSSSAQSLAAYVSSQPALENSILMNGDKVDVIKDVAGFLNPSDSAANEWVEYNINGTAGNYNLSARVASETGGSIDVFIDGEQTKAVPVAPTGSLQTWISISANINLPTPGTHKLRLVFNQKINLNWLNIVAANHALPVVNSTSNIAYNRPVFASSKEGDGFSASLAVDGKLATRWASNWKDPQWIYIDLGSSYNINKVILTWEAFGKSYEIQVSDNASQWTKIYATENGKGGVESIGLTGVGRYVRLYINKRSTEYGDSLFEFEVYGSRMVAPVVASNINKALNKPAFSSSVEGNVWNASHAVDDSSSTRWSSEFSDPQWIYVDLGSVQPINRVTLNWEGAFGKSYDIQVSDDKLTWTTVYTTVTGHGGIENISLSAAGRYVRIFCRERGTEYGYSLWNFEVY